MGTYGAYITEKELHRVGDTSVHIGRRNQSRKEVAIKVWASLPKAAAGDPLDAAKLQKAVCAKSRHWLKIHDFGRMGAETYVVCDVAQRSLQWLIKHRVALRERGLRHLALSITQGLRDLRTIASRGHGNLKPSNVFLQGPRRVDKSRVFVADPSPQHHSESEDIRALGELLFQVVTHARPGRNHSEWSVEPWQRLGPSGDKWRSLCVEMVDPLESNRPTLDQVIERVKKMPGGSGAGWPRVLVYSTVLAVVAVVGLYASWHYQTRTEWKKYEAAHSQWYSAMAQVLRPKDDAGSADVHARWIDHARLNSDGLKSNAYWSPILASWKTRQFQPPGSMSTFTPDDRDRIASAMTQVSELDAHITNWPWLKKVAEARDLFASAGSGWKEAAAYLATLSRCIEDRTGDAKAHEDYINGLPPYERLPAAIARLKRLEDDLAEHMDEVVSQFKTLQHLQEKFAVTGDPQLTQFRSRSLSLLSQHATAIQTSAGKPAEIRKAFSALSDGLRSVNQKGLAIEASLKNAGISGALPPALRPAETVTPKDQQSLIVWLVAWKADFDGKLEKREPVAVTPATMQRDPRLDWNLDQLLADAEAGLPTGDLAHATNPTASPDLTRDLETARQRVLAKRQELAALKASANAIKLLEFPAQLNAINQQYEAFNRQLAALSIDSVVQDYFDKKQKYEETGRSQMAQLASIISAAKLRPLPSAAAREKWLQFVAAQEAEPTRNPKLLEDPSYLKVVQLELNAGYGDIAGFVQAPMPAISFGQSGEQFKALGNVLQARLASAWQMQREQALQAKVLPEPLKSAALASELQKLDASTRSGLNSVASTAANVLDGCRELSDRQDQAYLVTESFTFQSQPATLGSVLATVEGWVNQQWPGDLDLRQQLDAVTTRTRAVLALKPAAEFEPVLIDFLKKQSSASMVRNADAMLRERRSAAGKPWPASLAELEIAGNVRDYLQGQFLRMSVARQSVLVPEFNRSGGNDLLQLLANPGADGMKKVYEAVTLEDKLRKFGVTKENEAAFKSDFPPAAQYFALVYPVALNLKDGKDDATIVEIVKLQTALEKLVKELAAKPNVAPEGIKRIESAVATLKALQQKPPEIAAPLAKPPAAAFLNDVTADAEKGTMYRFRAPDNTEFVFARIGTSNTYLGVTEVSIAMVNAALGHPAARKTQYTALKVKFLSDETEVLATRGVPNDGNDKRLGPRAMIFDDNNSALVPTTAWLLSHAPLTGSHYPGSDKRKIPTKIGIDPTLQHPMHRIPPIAADFVAASLSWRLPTSTEYKAAYQLQGRGSLPDGNKRDNLRDLTFLAQMKHGSDVKNLRYLKPTLKSFQELDGKSLGNYESDDGTLWFTPVGQGAQGDRFVNLVGNVAEYVRDGNNYFVVGLSALWSSKQDGADCRPDTLYPVAEPRLGYSDVGFRLAFDVAAGPPPKDPNQPSLASKFRDWLNNPTNLEL